MSAEPAPRARNSSLKWPFAWLKRQSAEKTDPHTAQAASDGDPAADSPPVNPLLAWRFREIRPEETLQNASHIEFFHNETLQSPVEALVREDIQNRLDACATPNGRVVVRYFIGSGEREEATHAPWFRHLSVHLNAPQVKSELGAGAELLDRPVRWLAIEDFGTTGLLGDPLAFHDLSTVGRTRNDFYWFVRNVGRSEKHSGDRGRWGLGKLVYALASNIRAYFAFTVRSNDIKRLLIGRSTLTMHHVDGMARDSEGYFGRFESLAHPYFATPETEPLVLDKFARDFHLTRREAEPGLSLVIAWPGESIT
ncbi:MAG: hypothetical protein ACOYMN_20635, partial [Roseimicrobium sp.]